MYFITPLNQTNNPNSLVFLEPLDILLYANVAKILGGALFTNDRYLDNKLCE